MQIRKIFIYAIFIIMLFPFSSFILAQTGLTWTTVKIEGHGRINLPSNMEIQAGQYKVNQEKIKEILGIAASKVIFQQSNLNSQSTDGFQTYARVMIKTAIGNKGTYQKLIELNYSAAEIQGINSKYKSEIYETAKSFNSEILEYTSAKLTKINGMPCITFGYSRKMGVNPPVKITIYIFENNDRQHLLTFEYRIKDELIWKPTFESILKSYKIDSIL